MKLYNLLFKLLLIITGFLVSETTNANVAFYHYGIENGLPESHIICISQDSMGFVWLAGENTVFRFDGHQFHKYESTSSNSSDVAFLKINTHFTDSKGRFYVGSNQGVSIYDFNSDKFITTEGNGLRRRVIDFDEDKNGMIWIASEFGLAKYNPENEQTQWFTDSTAAEEFENKVLPSGYINNIACQPDGKIWVNTFPNGLWRFDPEKQTIEDFNEIGGFSFDKINITQIRFIDDDLYISTVSNGFIWFNTKNETVNHLKTDLLTGNVHYFDAENDSILWLASNNGLFRLNRKSLEFSRFTNIPGDPLSMDRTALVFVNVDRSKNLWVSSGIRGVNYGLNYVPFSHLNVSGDRAYELSQKEVTAIQFDHIGNMWLGYEGGFVERHEHGPLSKKQIRLASAGDKIHPGSVMKIFEDSKNRVWTGGYNCGFQKLNSSGTRFDFAPVKPDSLSEMMHTADIRGMTEDSKGNIWLTLHGIGLGRYNPETFDLKLFRYNPKNSAGSLSNNWPFNLTTDTENNLWVASAYGVSKLNLEDETFTNFYHQDDNPNSLSGNAVKTIFCDSLGTIWAGAGNGLNIYIPAENTFKPVALSPNFGVQNVSGIESVKPGEIWFSTQNGIFRLNYKWLQNKDSISFDVRYFTRSDGLLSTNYFYNAVAVLEGNTMYFCGNQGIDFFHPEEVKEKPQNAEQIVLTEIDVDGRPAVLNSDSSNGLKSLKLDYSYRTLNIRFTSLSFNTYGEKQYRYKLMGFNDDWVIPENEYVATYTSLPPGNYSFRAGVFGKNGKWIDSEELLKITVKPPFWKTITFAVLLIAGLLILFILVSRTRSKILMKRQRELEGIVKQRTNELKQKNVELEKAVQTKNRFFSIISHDLRGPLSGQLGILELLNESEEIPAYKRNELLNAAFTSAKNIFSLLENLLLWASTQTSKIDFRPRKFDIGQLIQTNIELSREQAKQKSIIVEAFLPKEMQAFGDPDMIDTVIRNILNNAVKFTHTGGKVTVSGETDENDVIVHFADTGIGLTENQLKKLFDVSTNGRTGTTGEAGTGLGLIISQEFISRNKGKIWATPNEPGGTIFHITIPKSATN